MLRRLITYVALLVCALSAAQVYASTVVVLNSGDASVTLIDQASYKALRTFSVGKEPHHLMATPDNSSLIVASATGNELIFLDPKSGLEQRRLRGIIDPYQIGFSPNQKWFVSNALRLDRVDVYRYDGVELKLANRVRLPKTPSHMAFDADSSTVFITQQGSDQLSAIDLATQKVKWTMAVGKVPAGVLMAPDNQHLLIGIMGEDYVAVVDSKTQTVVKKIKTGIGAHNFRFLGDKRHVLVSNRMANNISVIDTKTMENVGTINVPGGPDCMEVSEDGKFLWVTLRWSKKVAVIDLATKTLITTINVGRSPHGIYFINRAPDA
ncbi:beta-propeller fold lactonase family protein [Herbaspirillum sp. RTI4]|uniref:YVTN family beta-propeller repeat protein n=1 Tax=Herbaspirillum sp. RTI4 TaxID=3048640 RepID=UPI002AB599F0|nr:beta-propeller fold lactonase family protein [Herbaspirillum sp. RTI4]MDY7579708.1 beta-propeller fold lactonase family protein [Herbaspirillum sp. RTI4]MEA9983035.1 beta-propeller fold lactonase family protein [Herbaspirillum sp. RTI4]